MPHFYFKHLLTFLFRRCENGCARGRGGRARKMATEEDGLGPKRRTGAGRPTLPRRSARAGRPAPRRSASARRPARPTSSTSAGRPNVGGGVQAPDYRHMRGGVRARGARRIRGVDSTSARRRSRPRRGTICERGMPGTGAPEGRTCAGAACFFNLMSLVTIL